MQEVGSTLLVIEYYKAYINGIRLEARRDILNGEKGQVKAVALKIGKDEEQIITLDQLRDLRDTTDALLNQLFEAGVIGAKYVIERKDAAE